VLFLLLWKFDQDEGSPTGRATDEGRTSSCLISWPRLSSTDCRMLLEKIACRIDSWTSKNLSFAGRLQLLASILYSLQVFWTGIFILPKNILKDIKQKFNQFLWNGKDGNSPKVKVAWDEVCFPKKGGLGFEESGGLESHFYATACMESVCALRIDLDCLVQEYLLKGKSFWSIRTPQNCSWS
jgi:hypothetical protein